MLDVTMVNGTASDQATNWMRAAVRELDKRFGEGYAERNPALVAAMVQAASSSTRPWPSRSRQASMREIGFVFPAKENTASMAAPPATCTCRFT